VCDTFVERGRVAVCCSVVRCGAVCCSALQCVAVCCSVGIVSMCDGFCTKDVLQCVAVWCSAGQCVAVCCSVLQRVAACCSVLQCIKPSDVYAMHQSSDENGMHRKNIQKKTYRMHSFPQ